MAPHGRGSAHGEKTAGAQCVPQTGAWSFPLPRRCPAGTAPSPKAENILFNDKFKTEADYLNVTSLCLQFLRIILWQPLLLMCEYICESDI